MASPARPKTPERGAVPLTDYQRASVMDPARFLFELWARQTGKSFSLALAAVDTTMETPPGWILLSRGERQSRQLIRTCATHARAYFKGAEILDEDYAVDEKRFRQLTLEFPNGGRIIGLPANPDTARGWSMNVGLDEFWIHKDAREIWAALFFTITRGYRIRIATTPMGKLHQAYKIWTDWTKRQADGDRNYSTRKITIHEAIAGGLALKDPLSGETLQDAEALRLALADDEIWAQEALCEILDEATAFLSYELIQGCEDDSIVGMPPWAVRLVEQAEERYREYLVSKIDQPVALEDLLAISKLSAIGQELYLGLDVGRRRDLSVIWLDDKIGSSLVTRAVIPMARTPFYIQQKVLWTLLERTPIRRACIDQTGIGAKLAEDAIDRFGAHRVEGIDFTAGNKEALAGGLRQVMEDRQTAIPVDPVIRNSFHSVKRIQTTTGHFRYDAERSEQTGHCYDRETELLTHSGWRRFDALTNEDEAATLHGDELAFERPTEIQRFQHRGMMVRVLNKQVDLLVTPNHRLWVRLPGAEHFGLIEADGLVGSTARVEFAKAARWIGSARESFTVGADTITAEAWLRFLGAFLAQGFTSTHHRVGIYGADRAGLAEILAPLPWSFWEEGRRSCPSRRVKCGSLWDELAPLGGQADRFVPRYVLDLPPSQLWSFWDGLFWGHGSRRPGWDFRTSSRRLADDVTEIALRLGMAARVRVWQPPAGGNNRRTMFLVNVNRYRLTPCVNRRRRSVTTEEYFGEVFCCTIPSGLLYVRRNGISVWCSNSDHFWAKALAVQAASGMVPWTLEGAGGTGIRRESADLGSYIGRGRAVPGGWL